ncbi:MAG: hypothetical protein AB1657_05180 [Candidatus Micrarchaeota archaeon]
MRNLALILLLLSCTFALYEKAQVEEWAISEDGDARASITIITMPNGAAYVASEYMADEIKSILESTTRDMFDTSFSRVENFQSHVYEDGGNLIYELEFDVRGFARNRDGVFRVIYNWEVPHRGYFWYSSVNISFSIPPGMSVLDGPASYTRSFSPQLSGNTVVWNLHDVMPAAKDGVAFDFGPSSRQADGTLDQDLVSVMGGGTQQENFQQPASSQETGLSFQLWFYALLVLLAIVAVILAIAAKTIDWEWGKWILLALVMIFVFIVAAQVFIYLAILLWILFGLKGEGGYWSGGGGGFGGGFSGGSGGGIGGGRI